MTKTIISYCNGTWPSTGGVARYDTQLKLIFPERKFFKGPQEKEKLLEYLKKCNNPIIITDNHLACDIPNKYFIYLVHHGCALTTAERNPDWDPYWRDLCCNGQKKMFLHRKKDNTKIISISTACTDDFTKYYPDLYNKFERIDLLHSSELNESKYIKKFNKNPIILGNWGHLKKGKNIIPKLKKMLPKFEFRQLNVKPEKGESLENFNKRKQGKYLECDIFLQMSNSEGFSYASNDALLCGLVNVCTNVGAYYKDVSEDCFVKLEWDKCFIEEDYSYIKQKIEYAWDNKEGLSKNGRLWYLENCKFENWSNKMKEIIKS